MALLYNIIYGIWRRGKLAKKYRYAVTQFAEDEVTGTIDLTKKEAELIARVTNPANWHNCCGDGDCGYF